VSAVGTEVASAPLLASLRRLGLIGADVPPMRPLGGGVSSEVWRIELPSGPVCVKRALPRLNVAALWEAPVERSRFEVAWLNVANEIVPGIGPDVLAHDDGGAIVLAYLDPDTHPVWKAQLRDGRADPAVAAAVGRRLGRVHAATVQRPELARRFDNADLFAVMRLEPYLGAVARVHPDLSGELAAIGASFATHAMAMVHGDASPKNILAGPAGPVLLDSECATWGDPAFDLGFCASHLLLKCRWNPAAAAGLLACFDALVAGYAAEVAWEDPGAVAARAARWVAACLLARVDGLSPVEYLDGAARASTRAVARRLVADPGAGIAGVRAAWSHSLRTAPPYGGSPAPV
jgi:tRNA A-37 threonylcarbamoyl transferase component Bud32